MGKRRKKNRTPHIAADLTTPEGRKRARREMIWGDHGFLRARFSNLHALSDEMWRANQPSPRQIADHKAERGIRTIINLRGVSTRGYYLLEAEACAENGIDLVDYQVFSRDTPTSEAVLGTRDLFEDLAYPALMHCKSGADRAGLMSVLYMIARRGQSVEQAIEQLSFKYLHVKQGKTGMLDAFFHAALAAGANAPDDFYSWIRNDYDRMAIKTAFLQKRQRLELDRILGRE
ncbi:MAG: protein tyrosine phosphatase [Hyphomonadaceae bacterium]